MPTCKVCGKTFEKMRSQQQHYRDAHMPKGARSLPLDCVDSEPSFASRLIDAQLEVAMGGYADDDLIDHL